MANSIDNNPKILDTVGSTSVINGNVTLGTIIWSGYTGGATMEITNAAGTRTLYKWTAPATYALLDVHFDGGVNHSEGIALKTLSSGVLYLYQSRR